MNAVGILILAILMYCVLALSKRGALLGMALGVLYLPVTQSFDIAGFQMHAIRFLELAVFLRVISRREFSISLLNRLDVLFLCVYLFTLTVFLLRSDESQGTFARIAKTLDGLLTYFAFRAFIQDFDDLRWFLGALVFALVPYVSLLLIERFGSAGAFSFLGAERDVAWIRGDRVRCFGTFRHPSILGSLGAVFLPLFIGLLWDPTRRRGALAGMLLCSTVVAASNSGGPLSVWAFGVVAWTSWLFRYNMRTLRWGILGCILALALVMNSPVYYIMARLSAVTGGTGWHRSYLIEVSLKHFADWGLIGMPLAETGDWFPYRLSSGAADITNQFISFGIQAGIGAILLFCLLLTYAFRLIGKALEKIRATGSDTLEEPLLWGMGVALAVHIVNWQGITYFDQFNVFWMLQLASISSLCSHALSEVHAEEHLLTDHAAIEPGEATA